MTKKRRSQPQQLTSQSLQSVQSVQPWLRDHYAALRAEAGPRLQHTREVVVPVVVDTSHKVRDEYVPAAMQMSARVAEEAMQRSAPLRAELSERAAAAVAGARGQLTAAQLAQLGQLKQVKQLKDQMGRKAQRHNDTGKGSRSHRKLWFIGGAAVGAALGAAVLWQRSRYQAWVEDDDTHNAMDDGMPTPERLNTDDPNHNNSSDANDGGANAHASSSGKHSDKRQ